LIIDYLLGWSLIVTNMSSNWNHHD